MRVVGLRKGLKIAVIAAAAAGIFSFAVMTLWNWVVPPVIGWRAIGYGQAFGLLLLSRILFGGTGRRWRPRMVSNWRQLTPDEREKFRAGMRGRCFPGEQERTPSSAV